MTQSDRPQRALLTSLIILQAVMLASLFAGVAPHPPATTPVFGIGPFLGVALAVTASAIIIGPAEGRMGPILSGFAALAALMSFGPQKYFDAQFSLIWPAVLAGQFAAGALLISCFAQLARVRKLRSNP